MANGECRFMIRNGSGFRVDFSASNHWEISIPQGDLDGENDDHELELELSGAPFFRTNDLFRSTLGMVKTWGCHKDTET